MKKESSRKPVLVKSQTSQLLHSCLLPCSLKSLLHPAGLFCFTWFVGTWGKVLVVIAKSQQLWKPSHCSPLALAPTCQHLLGASGELVLPHPPLYLVREEKSYQLPFPVFAELGIEAHSQSIPGAARATNFIPGLSSNYRTHCCPPQKCRSNSRRISTLSYVSCGLVRSFLSTLINIYIYL